MAYLQTRTGRGRWRIRNRIESTTYRVLRPEKNLQKGNSMRHVVYFILAPKANVVKIGHVSDQRGYSDYDIETGWKSIGIN